MWKLLKITDVEKGFYTFSDKIKSKEKIYMVLQKSKVHGCSNSEKIFESNILAEY